MPAAVPNSVREREAKALATLYAKLTSLSHGDFARRAGFSSAAVVWQLLKGHRPLNLIAAARFAVGLGCHIREFSPRLDREATLVVEGAGTSTGAPSAPREAREPPSAYNASHWPFRTISATRWNKLDPHQRGVIEGIVRAHVLDWESGRQGDT